MHIECSLYYEFRGGLLPADCVCSDGSGTFQPIHSKPVDKSTR